MRSNAKCQFAIDNTGKRFAQEQYYVPDRLPFVQREQRERDASVRITRSRQPRRISIADGGRITAFRCFSRNETRTRARGCRPLRRDIFNAQEYRPPCERPFSTRATELIKYLSLSLSALGGWTLPAGTAKLPASWLKSLSDCPSTPRTGARVKLRSHTVSFSIIISIPANTLIPGKIRPRPNSGKPISHAAVSAHPEISLRGAEERHAGVHRVSRGRRPIVSVYSLNYAGGTAKTSLPTQQFPI